VFSVGISQNIAFHIHSDGDLQRMRRVMYRYLFYKAETVFIFKTKEISCNSRQIHTSINLNSTVGHFSKSLYTHF